MYNLVLYVASCCTYKLQLLGWSLCNSLTIGLPELLLQEAICLGFLMYKISWPMCR